MQTKGLLRRLFYRSAFFRSVITGFSLLANRTKPTGSLHLAAYGDQGVIGPLQQPEALLLFSLVQCTAPLTLVEFGFYHGHSSFNFLRAMRPDARLFSFDVAGESARIAAEEFVQDERFCFIHKSQSEFTPDDVGNRRVDFAFFDAAHDLQLNQTTFERLRPCLNPEAIVCVHDTGLWPKAFFGPGHFEIVEQQNNSGWVDENNYAHRNDERIFVNWILQTYPDFHCLNIHSTRVLRHGLSLLQRHKVLATG